MDEIPRYVIRTLKTIRRNGATNMLARKAVIDFALLEDEAAAAWLMQNKERYGEALEAMSNRSNPEDDPNYEGHPGTGGFYES